MLQSLLCTQCISTLMVTKNKKSKEEEKMLPTAYGNKLYSLTSPQLMEMPSFALSPVAPVRFNLSDPARSTKWNLAVRVSNSFISEDSVIILLSVALSWNKEEPIKFSKIFHINICLLQSSINDYHHVYVLPYLLILFQQQYLPNYFHFNPMY